MDGGRILRSLLAIRLGKLRSTKIASLIGKIIAVFFLISGILIPHLFLALIGLFVFVMATQEARSVKVEEILSKYKVEKIFNRNIIKINPEDKMEILIDFVYRSVAKNFLVFEEDEIIGCVPELFVWEAINKKNEHKTVREYMSDKFIIITPGLNVSDVYQQMNEKGYSIMAVKEKGQILGYIDRSIIQNLAESSSKLK